jgi:hypothetical protein
MACLLLYGRSDYISANLRLLTSKPVAGFDVYRHAGLTAIVELLLTSDLGFQLTIDIAYAKPNHNSPCSIYVRQLP